MLSYLNCDKTVKRKTMQESRQLSLSLLSSANITENNFILKTDCFFPKRQQNKVLLNRGNKSRKIYLSINNILSEKNWKHNGVPKMHETCN